MTSRASTPYRNIFIATSLFGGVQFYQILIRIIRSKFVAILLGPEGIGIVGLLQSGTQLIQSFTNMGLASSAVRDVSEANGTGDNQRISKTVCVVRKLVWFTGILGLLVTAFCSPILSKMSFGNYDYTIPFIVLSITLLIDQLSAGQMVVLQGLRKLKDLAKCSSYGTTLGLFISVPIYYWLGIEGIVPTLVLSSLCSLFLSWLFSRKIKIEKVNITPKVAIREGRQMLTMGISMSLNGIFGTATAYIIRIFIQDSAGIEMVGLYQAGIIIISTYVGLIFSAIGTDYYPRLAAINQDNAKCSEAVSQQGEIATMILGPMLTVCIVYMPFMLTLLYSSQFVAANEYVSWACLGMMLRLAAWVISFLFVAKAESKLFIVNEGLACIYTVLFNIVGFKYWGLQGIGLAFALEYLVYFIQVYAIAKRRYELKLSIGFVKTYAIQLLCIVICLCVVLSTEGVLKYLLGSIVIIISSVLALVGMNRKMDVAAFIKERLGK